MRSLLLCASLLAPCALAAQALPSVPGETPVPVLWERFLAEADASVIAAAFEQVNAVFDETGEINAEACSQNREALQIATQNVPVSIAVWYAEMECAQVLGDEPALEHAITAFAALSRYALERNPEPGSLERPIPIVNEADAWLLLKAMEFELGYAHHPLPLGGPHLPLVMSVIDPQQQLEHLLAFDVVDTWRQLMMREPEQVTPAFAFAFQSSLIEANATRDEQTPAASLRRLIKAVQSSPVSARLTALSELAAEGEFGAARALYSMCIAVDRNDCGERAIDALLPLAELELAEPTWMLAMAYAQGRGVKRDPRAAARLFDRADARLGAHRGSLAAARDWLVLRKQTRLPPALGKRLKTLAAKGNSTAAELLLLEQINGFMVSKPSARQLRGIQAAASASDPTVRGGYGALLSDQNDPAGIQLLREAAAGGDAGSTLAMISLLEHSPALSDDPAELPRLLRQAGLLGHKAASRKMADHHADARDMELAQQWYASAFLQGDADSGYQAARLAWNWPGAFEGGVAAAIELLTGVLAQADHVPARRLLAEMLMFEAEGEAEPEIRQRAARLLRENTAKGDAESTIMLASALLQGRIETEAGEDGEQMLRRLAAQDEVQAMDTLAMLIHGRILASTATEAFELWRRASASGLRRAQNNLAWMLCTSTDPDYYDPAQGLVEARALAEGDNLPPSFRDTIATCYASAGDFEAAIEQQTALIADFENSAGDGANLQYFRDKLAAFERGEAFREGPGAAEEAIGAAADSSGTPKTD